MAENSAVYKISKFNVVDYEGESVASDVELVTTADNIKVVNPDGTEQVYDATLTDALFAKFETVNVTTEDGGNKPAVVKNGYHKIDLDNWSVADALAKLQVEYNKRFFGIYNDNGATENSFLEDSTVRTSWLKNNLAALTDDQRNSLTEALNKANNSSFVQEMLLILNEQAVKFNEKVSSAETATTNANKATLSANTAAADADKAKDATLEAISDAATATTNANNAATYASAEAEKATTATTNANEAATYANTEAGKAATATINANEATSRANTAAGKAEDRIKELENYDIRLTNAEQTISNNTDNIENVKKFLKIDAILNLSVVYINNCTWTKDAMVLFPWGGSNPRFFIDEGNGVIRLNFLPDENFLGINALYSSLKTIKKFFNETHDNLGYVGPYLTVLDTGNYPYGNLSQPFALQGNFSAFIQVESPFYGESILTFELISKNRHIKFGFNYGSSFWNSSEDDNPTQFILFFDNFEAFYPIQGKDLPSFYPKDNDSSYYNYYYSIINTQGHFWVTLSDYRTSFPQFISTLEV